MSDEILSPLLKEYAEIHHKMVDNCKSIDKEIANLQEETTNLQEYREMLTKPYRDMLDNIRLKIQLIMNDRKSSFKCDYGKIIYTKAGIRRSWNLDALDMVCDGNPMVKQFIWAFRKEEPFDEKISIKVN